MTTNEMTKKYGLIDWDTLTQAEVEKRMSGETGMTWAERVKATVKAAAGRMSLPYEAVPSYAS